MPKTAFLHKKSLLDTFKDDYRVTNPIKAARAERTWDNPIVRHKREHEINKWAHSFAGKKHFRKLTRFNATREANESCRVLYPLEDVVKVVTDALRTIRTRIYQVDGYYQFIQDKLQYGMVVAKDIAHRDFPYRWEVQANLVTRLKKGNEIVMEYHPDTPEQLSEYLQEEGALEPNEAKMKIRVRESKKNEKDEPTYVWFGLEHDEDGDYTDSLAVFVDDVSNGMVTVYAHMGQHSSASLDYVAGLEADPNPKGDLYKELIRQGYDNLVVVNTDVAEDMLGIRMHPDDDARELEDPEKYDKYEAREVKTAWTYLGELEKLEGADSRKDAQSKLLTALGFTQGTEGRWYDDEGEDINIIDVLDNTEWDFAVKTCGPLQESRNAREDFYKGKDRGFLVLVQKLIADNWYAGARKEYPSLTLDCYERDGAGDDMKICFEAYGEEIDDPMSDGLMEVAEESAKKGCADANRSTDPLIADYGLEANFISWDEPDVFRDQWNYVINLSSKPKGKKGESADEKLGYEKGHKNSKGEPAPWVIRSHKDNSVLASFAKKEDAYAHLQRMKQYSKSEGLDSYIKDVKALLKSKYGIDVDNGKQASLYSGWMEKLDACHYKGLSAEDCAEEVAKFTGLRKSEARPTRQASQIKELCDMCRKDKQVADAVFKALTKDYNTSLDPVLAGQYLTKSWKAKLEELGGCNGWYDGFKKLYADMGVDFICSVLQDLKLGSSEIGCGACTSIVQDIYSRLAKKDETAKDGERAVDDYDTLRDGLVKLGYTPSSDVRNGKVYSYRPRFTATKDGVKYSFWLHEEGEYIDYVTVSGGEFDEDGTKFNSVSDLLSALGANKSEGLEKNGVIVVPEWLWVAYETGDSSNLSVEEEQILDGFRAMAAGKVFDAEAEPSFRAFNDFDDYAGDCYEVQVYTIKESK